MDSVEDVHRQGPLSDPIAGGRGGRGGVVGTGLDSPGDFSDKPLASESADEELN